MYKKKRLNPQQAVTFRRFSRGRWAIFASLKRPVRIGVLALGMLGSVSIEKVEARSIDVPGEETEADERELTEVTVSGTLAPLTQLQSARMVGVITRQDIEQAAAHSVNDLLKLAVGTDVRQRGGFGIQTDISINGGTFDQVTILLNGLNISNPHTGHLAADFPVSISDIERIEILEGAASRVYGASAFGGAINIVTKKEAGGEVALQAGSYGTVGAEARVALTPHPSSLDPRPSTLNLQPSTLNPRLSPLDPHPSSSLSASFLRSDGATPNSDFSRGHAYWQGQWQLPRVLLHGQAGWSGKNYGANTFYSAAYPNQYERNRRFIAHMGASTQGRLRLHPEVYWQRMTDNFELTRHSETGENFHCTDVWGARLAADMNWKLGHTALAVEVRREGIYSTNLGRPTTDTRKIPGEDTRRYDHHDSRTNVALSLEHNILLEQLTVSFGLTANMNTYLDRSFRLYPGVDASWRPAPGWKLFASYNKGFRLPTFTDLYYKAPTHQGNVGLRPEVSHSFQVGAQWRTSALSVTAKAFYHHGTDMIDWVMYNATDTYHSANFDLDNMGLQLQTNFQLSIFNCKFSYAFMHQHRKDASPIYKSNYAMEYLHHKLVATLEHPLWSRLKASWSLRWQDRMGSYILYENAQSTGRLVSYSPYATLDLKLRWTAPRYELWVEGTNLTNHTYYDLGNIPQPGLLIMSGARVRF